MTGLYKEYLKEAKVLLSKSCGLVYLLITFKTFFMEVIGGKGSQVNVYLWCQQMAHDQFYCVAGEQ